MRKHLTKWEILMDYLRGVEIGTIISRKDLFDNTGEKDYRYETTIDHYRRLLTGCGYLKHHHTGHYEVIKMPPIGYTISALQREWQRLNNPTKDLWEV